MSPLGSVCPRESQAPRLGLQPGAARGERRTSPPWEVRLQMLLILRQAAPRGAARRQSACRTLPNKIFPLPCWRPKKSHTVRVTLYLRDRRRYEDNNLVLAWQRETGLWVSALASGVTLVCQPPSSAVSR